MMMTLLSRSFLFVAASWLSVNAIDDRALSDSTNTMETMMTRHEMLHSTRQLTVEDVQSMSLFAEMDRMRESRNPKIGQTLHDFISDDALGLVTEDYYINHLLIANLQGGSKKVLVEVVGDAIANIEDVLTKNGFDVSNCYKYTCSMYASPDDITAIARLSQVTSIYASMPLSTTRSESINEKRHRKLQGSVTSEGVIAHRVDKARAKYNVDGTGILIGIIGISFNCLNGAANDTLTGDLPPSSSITILRDLNATECAASNRGDDGRMEMQVIYDIAPGAKFVFHSAFQDEAANLRAIMALADAGCNIIVDNLFSDFDPWFQDGPNAQVAGDIVDRGISYVTGISYFPGRAWDAPSGFVPSGISPPNSTSQFHLFGNTSNGSPIISQRVGLPNTGSNVEIVIFQFDEPSLKSSGPPGAQADLDIILLFNGTGANRITFLAPTANIGGEPGEGGFVVPALTGSRNSTVFFDMFIVHKSGRFPKFMKVIIRSDTTVIPMYEFATNTTTLVGKTNSKATTVMQVRTRNSPAFNVTPPIATVAFGPGNPIVFDRFGNRTQTPLIRQPIRYAAINDGAFANPAALRAISPNNVAHAAGIMALMLQAKGGPKSLTPQQINNFLEVSAIDMDDPGTPGFDVGFDNATGAGFIDALGALDAATATKAPTKAPTKNPTKAPTKKPTKAPTKAPTKKPTTAPTLVPSMAPTQKPTKKPTLAPTRRRFICFIPILRRFFASCF